ncbi:hypothetical protein ACFOU0_10480 [Salinicoccus sesuvii]|uniref:Uncharacterized protein n=1 Tax=Salinicoccus sesuvii TaxID=868281 RepID=A0ABV7N8X8_9STAP
MKPIFLIFAAVLLTACSTTIEQDSDFESLASDRPYIKTMTHQNIQLSSAIHQQGKRDYSNSLSTTTVNADGTSVEYTQQEMAEIEELAQQVDHIKQDVTGIWKADFTPMYNQFLWNRLGKDKTAERLERLHESYGQLEADLDGIKTPEFLDDRDSRILEHLKDDLYLAISNRTLALIEFKLMNQDDDYKMSETMLDIHVQNSSNYLMSADESLDQLEALEHKVEHPRKDLLVVEE